MAVGAGGKAVGVGKNERGGMHGVLRGEGLALAQQLARQKDLIIRGRGNQCPKRGQKLEFLVRTSILNFKLTTLKLILRARFLKLKKQLDTF